MAIIYGTRYEALNNDELEKARKDGQKVVIVSGTFDLTHYGHVNLMRAAKERGDILVVAVKGDLGASLKKEDPPVMNQDIRMQMVASIIYPDYVILADYDPTRKLPSYTFKNTASYEWLNMFEPAIKAIKPDIFVHEDNKTIADARRQLFERYGVKGIIQPRTEGISTTEIIDRIKTRVLIKMQKDKSKEQ